MIKQMKKRFSRNIDRIIYNDDLFIVEFPKSGITWLTTILANTICLQNQLNLSPTHFNLEQFVADIHVSPQISHKVYNFPGYRIIKSHSQYNQNYRHVIYLIRHPYSVMKSYYHFTTNNLTYSGSFNNFLANKEYGIKAWCKHVNSWLNPVKPLKLHMIRYEDLIEDPFKAIEKIYINIGWKVSKTCIEKSINKSDFSLMKSNDELYKKHCPFRKYSFVREGKKNATIDDESKKYIDHHAKKTISLFYHGKEEGE